MNSREKDPGFVLAEITPQKARIFLERLANLGNDLDKIERFRRNYGHWFSTRVLSLPISRVAGESVRLSEGVGQRSIREILQTPILQSRNLLQSIWMTENARSRERLARYFLTWIEQNCVPVALDLSSHLEMPLALGTVYPPVALEEAARYLLQSLPRLARCKSRECVEPFFFMQHRNQLYCSPQCALPAKREAKRRWWNEHGSDWVASRAKPKTQRKVGRSNGRNISKKGS
jgi:hypothetical protein